MQEKKKSVYNPESQKKWEEKNKDVRRYVNDKSAAKRFIKKARLDDLEEIKKLTDEQYERVSKMTYYVIENRNVGMVGSPSFVETVLFSGTEEECVAFETEKRKEYRATFGDEFGVAVDCSTISAEKLKASKEAEDFWESLSDEEKNEKIVVDGATYNKAIYEKTHV